MRQDTLEDIEEATDGRRAWRERNRNAVVDALLDLYQDGFARPSAVDIAERSGVSRRSLFRYFDDMDELCRVAIERQSARVSHFFPIEALGEGPLDDRINRLVDQRCRLFEVIAPVARVARMRAHLQPILEEQLQADSALLRRQLERQIEQELKRLESRARKMALAAADVLTSFESYELLTNRQGLSTPEAAAVMRDGLTALLKDR